MSACNYNILQSDTNAIKGIAIMAMLWHHLFFQHPEYGAFVYQLGLLGKVCVALFVFCSGYGLSIQYKKQLDSNNRNSVISFFTCTLRFWFKRYIKFYLNYWTVFLVAVPIGVLFFGRELEIPYGGSNVLKSFIFDFFGVGSFNSYNITWWFNRLILSLYLLFPLLYLILNSKYRIFSIIFFILLFEFPNYVLKPFLWMDPSLYVYYLPFIVGILYASYEDYISRVLDKAGGKTVFLFSCLMTLFFCINRQYPLISSGGRIIDSLISLFIAMSVVSFRTVSCQNLKFLTYLGKHSMNIYLLHTFVAGYFFTDFIYGFTIPILIFAVQLLISLILSVTLELIKEKANFYKLQQCVLSFVN